MSAQNARYPDVLGALARGARAAFGPLQCALAVRPEIVPAGRPFEVLLLAQNTSDQTVDLSATLHLPETDARRQKGRFIPPNNKLVVAVKPAEVGCLVLPVATLPDAAPGAEYRLSVDVAVKAPNGGRLRAAEGAFSIDMLSAEGRTHFDALRGLSFSVAKPALRSALETTFAIGAPRPALPPDLKADWISLWSLADGDDRTLLERYGELLITRVFPQLKRTLVYPPLMEATVDRFEKAGYPLHDAEAALITKVMTIIVEYANPRERGHGYQVAGKYAIEPLLALVRKDPTRSLTLPRWMSRYLRLIAQDERAADHLARLISRSLYVPLLEDAIEYSFALVSQASGQIMGGDDDIAAYAASVVRGLEAGPMDFQRTYLPLILGGVMINDKVLMLGELQDEKISYLVTAFKERELHVEPEDEDVVDLTQQIIQRATKIYGKREET